MDIIRAQLYPTIRYVGIIKMPFNQSMVSSEEKSKVQQGENSMGVGEMGACHVAEFRAENPQAFVPHAFLPITFRQQRPVSAPPQSQANGKRQETNTLTSKPHQTAQSVLIASIPQSCNLTSSTQNMDTLQRIALTPLLIGIHSIDIISQLLTPSASTYRSGSSTKVPKHVGFSLVTSKSSGSSSSSRVLRGSAAGTCSPRGSVKGKEKARSDGADWGVMEREMISCVEEIVEWGKGNGVEEISLCNEDGEYIHGRPNCLREVLIMGLVFTVSRPTTKRSPSPDPPPSLLPPLSALIRHLLSSPLHPQPPPNRYFRLKPACAAARARGGRRPERS